MNRIPKVIHYCWLSGDEYPELIQKCINSWKEKLPDYKIKLWNTQNFDVNVCRYTKEAFEAKKYTYVSDYIRLYALYNDGGIYLDSDIEVLRNFDDMLSNQGFTCFENNHSVAAWIFGSEKGNPLFKEFLEYYDGRSFLLSDGTIDWTPNPIPITNICQKHGLVLNGEEQDLGYIKVYPQEYFCPYDRATETLNITNHTYCIHYFNGSWISDQKKRIIERRKDVIKKYGKTAGYVYYGIGVMKTDGARQFLREIKFMLKK